jgi:hypothetical protein
MAERGLDQSELAARQAAVTAAAELSGKAAATETDYLGRAIPGQSQKSYREDVLIPGQDITRQQNWRMEASAGIQPAQPGKPTPEGYFESTDPSGNKHWVPTLETKYGTSRVKNVTVTDQLAAMYGLDPTYIGSTLPVDAFKDLTKRDVAGIRADTQKSIADQRNAVQKEMNQIRRDANEIRKTAYQVSNAQDIALSTSRVESLRQRAYQNLIKANTDMANNTLAGSEERRDAEKIISEYNTVLEELNRLADDQLRRHQRIMGGGGPDQPPPPPPPLTPRQKALGLGQGARRPTPPPDLPPPVIIEP